MPMKSNYEKYPNIPVSTSAKQCWVGWRDINSRLRSPSAESRYVLCVECYPGAFENQLKHALESGLRPAHVIYAPDLLKPAQCIDDMLRGVLGYDPLHSKTGEWRLRSRRSKESCESSVPGCSIF